VAENSQISNTISANHKTAEQIYTRPSIIYHNKSNNLDREKSAKIFA